MKARTFNFWRRFHKWVFPVVGVLGCLGCSGTYWETGTFSRTVPSTPTNYASALEPTAEDIPFFKAIAEDQEKQLSLCENQEECRSVHFLRGLAALYENRELSAFHFRKVIASRPNSSLAGESRFWLWFLDVLNSPGGGGLTSQELIKRLTREVVEKEFQIHELSGKLENVSVEALQKELAIRDRAVEDLNLVIANLTKQVDQFQQEQVLVQGLQQELKGSERKVLELTNQLEALRRIDQEIKEKVPPTRPSEKMTPTAEPENVIEKGLPNEGKDQQ